MSDGSVVSTVTGRLSGGTNGRLEGLENCTDGQQGRIIGRRANKCAVRLRTICASSALAGASLTAPPGSEMCRLFVYVLRSCSVPATTTRRRDEDATHIETGLLFEGGREKKQRQKEKRKESKKGRLFLRPKRSELAVRQSQMAEAARESIRGRAEETAGEL